MWRHAKRLKSLAARSAAVREYCLSRRDRHHVEGESVMDPAPPKYAVASEDEILDLVRRHPFAWIVSADDGFAATPLPVLPETSAEGALVALRGHFGSGSLHLQRLRLRPGCLILFMGEHGYVSPSWMVDRTQAPTWNYETVAFECDVRFLEQPTDAKEHLSELTAIHEKGRPHCWDLADMGERYDRLAKGVAPFRAEIRARRAVFKLGQDERPDVYADILVGLDRTGAVPLADRMRARAALVT